MPFSSFFFLIKKKEEKFFVNKINILEDITMDKILKITDSP